MATPILSLRSVFCKEHLFIENSLRDEQNTITTHNLENIPI